MNHCRDFKENRRILYLKRKIKYFYIRNCFNGYKNKKIKGKIKKWT